MLEEVRRLSKELQVPVPAQLEREPFVAAHEGALLVAEGLTPSRVIEALGIPRFIQQRFLEKVIESAREPATPIALDLFNLAHAALGPALPAALTPLGGIAVQRLYNKLVSTFLGGESISERIRTRLGE